MPWSSAIRTAFPRAGNNNSFKPGGPEARVNDSLKVAVAAVLVIQLSGCITHTRQPESAAVTDSRGAGVSGLSIADVHARLSSGGGASRVHDLVDEYLARISAIDAHGPTLHSVIEVNPDARSIADRLDRSSASRGPLFGVPILIKDNIDTADRMLTTAGSLALVDS